MAKKIPLWETHEFQAAWLRAEMEGQCDWNHAQKLVNKALKEVVPDHDLTVQGLLNANQYQFSEKLGMTVLFHNEHPAVRFGFPSGPDGEFIVEKWKDKLL